MANQENWRFCHKCQAMFFNSFPNKGRCPAGSGHRQESPGINFFLPHDVPPTTHAQSAWRFCRKCHALFFDGFPTKGSCAGGGHEAQGFRFVLPFKGNLHDDMEHNPVNE